MSDFESENSCYQACAIQTRHRMHQTHENMDFHENTDSGSDTKVIESIHAVHRQADRTIRLCRNRR